jgi:hypothetical protein
MQVFNEVLYSIAGLLARLDEPEPFVDASCDLGEDISGIGVQEFGLLSAGIYKRARRVLRSKTFAR